MESCSTSSHLSPDLFCRIIPFGQIMGHRSIHVKEMQKSTQMFVWTRWFESDSGISFGSSFGLTL